MDALEELLARDQIRQLAERYGVAVDAKDLDALAVLFAEDVTNGRYGPGREGVKTYYDHVLRQFHCTMHLVANHVIDFDDEDHAHGVVYCRAHHHVPEPEHWFDMALAYWDTYERIDGRWYFRRRQLKSWYRQTWGHPDEPDHRLHSESQSSGARRGTQMPEAFRTWDDYWTRPPRPLPSA
jgi:ketosteroid isomerase-like protein